MTRLVEVTFWLLSAAAAVAAAFLLGYFGWAAIIVWTTLVLPCAWYRHRRLASPSWPSPVLRQLWGIAVVFNLAWGLLPMLLVRFPAAPDADYPILGALFGGLAWIGIVLSAFVVGMVTWGVLQRPSSIDAGAA